MSYLVGPVGVLGHPFRHGGHELVVERQVGGRLCYAFDSKWLHTDLEFEPAEEVQAVVVWDPAWLRRGVLGHEVQELRRVWEISRKLEVPLVAVYSDWFAGWETTNTRIGTKDSVMHMDAIVIDPAGKAALRECIPPLKITDPRDRRYRPIVPLTNLMSYGRLPVLGGDPQQVLQVPEKHPQAGRSIDVSYVGHAHPGNVVLRSYYLRALRDMCESSGMTYWFTDKATPDELERVYLDSKVVFNHSLGSTLNMRCFEALACGAVLLTDSHNIGNWSLHGVEYPYGGLQDMRLALRGLLDNPEVRQEHAEMGVQWAVQHSPDAVWGRNFDAVEKALHMIPKATATA